MYPSIVARGARVGVGQETPPLPPTPEPPDVTPPTEVAAPPNTHVVRGLQELDKAVADYTMVTLAAMYFAVPTGATQTPDLQTYAALTAERYAELSGSPPTVAPGFDFGAERVIIDTDDLARWAETGQADQMLVMVARTREIAAGIAEPGSRFAVVTPLESAGARAPGAAPAEKKRRTALVVGAAAIAATIALVALT